MPRALSTTTAVQAETSSERDLVNFPRRTRPIDPAPVRHHWIPEEYFTFFHNKTGVTGPYVFAATFTTYLCSKEIWVLEHEFYSGIAFAVVMGGVIKMASPGVTKWLDEEVDKHDGKLKKIRQDEIDKCKSAIGAENDAQWMATSYEELINAKKDNVGLQLEAAYRSRLQQAYTQVITKFVILKALSLF
jgi:F-type H+-transporting ATPase subunit b